MEHENTFREKIQLSNIEKILFGGTALFSIAAMSYLGCSAIMEIWRAF